MPSKMPAMVYKCDYYIWHNNKYLPLAIIKTILYVIAAVAAFPVYALSYYFIVWILDSLAVRLMNSLTIAPDTIDKVRVRMLHAINLAFIASGILFCLYWDGPRLWVVILTTAVLFLAIAVTYSVVKDKRVEEKAGNAGTESPKEKSIATFKVSRELVELIAGKKYTEAMEKLDAEMKVEAPGEYGFILYLICCTCTANYGKIIEAFETYGTAVSLGYGHHAIVAEAYIRCNELEKARACMDKYEKEGMDMVEDNFNYAMRYFDEGKSAVAIYWYNEHVAPLNIDRNIFSTYIQKCCLTENYQAGADAFRNRNRKLKKLSYTDYENVALVYMKLNDRAMVCVCYEECLVHYPGNIGMMKLLAHLCVLENTQKSVELYDSIILIEGDVSATYAARATAKITLNMYDSAYADLMKAVALDERNAEAYVTLGLYYISLEKFGQAHEQLVKARSINKNLTEIDKRIRYAKHMMDNA